MKIAVKDLDEPCEITIQGTEAWLGSIYKNFSSSSVPPGIAGYAVLKRDSAGFVNVSGEVSFAPTLPCSRCDDPLEWPIKASLAATFRPENSASLGQDDEEGADDEDFVEDSASSGNTEEYTIVGGEVDLALLINDALHLELPSQIIRVDAKGEKCLVCGVDVRESCLYASPQATRSPFAGLEGLLKQKKP